MAEFRAGQRRFGLTIYRKQKGGDNMKKAYTTPELTVHGNVEEITLGNSSGKYLDAAFPVDTAFSDLTFSNHTK